MTRVARAPEERRRRRRRWSGILTLSLIGLSLTLVEALDVARRKSEPLAMRDAIRAPTLSDPNFERTLELLTGTQIDPGNRVEYLLNGDGTFPALWRDLRSAQRAIAIQMYYAKPGIVGDTLAAILCERSRAGVRALLLLDAFGSEGVRRSWLNRMRQCGVEVALLRKLQWYTIHSATDRSHARAVIIDGRVGYTGGFGLADYWLGDGHHAGQWRESNVRFVGPAVGGLQAAFAAAWREATGELIVDGPFFPSTVDSIERGDTGGVRAGVLFTAATIGNTAAERFLALAIRSARARLYIANSYFVPNQEFRRLLINAADRGVDVRILTVSSQTDVKTPWLAGRSYYHELVSHGVRVYEYQPAMMHAKTMVIDGTWSAIGSMNFDSRSLAFNDETNLLVLDRTFGAQMEAVFLDDLRCAQEMTSSVLARRSWWQRLLERGATGFSRIL